MPRTTKCTSCGTVLNIPAEAAGKRLKCPKCGTKFHADVASSGTISTHDATPADPSSQEIRRGHGDLDLPTSSGDLRETFDLPLLGELAAETRPAKATPARPANDALALFEDGPPKPTSRRPAGAEARSKARRCPTCGGHIPVGMSICQTCGLDLETGMRVGLDDDLAPPPPVASSSLPLHVMLVGGICALGGGLLAAYSAYQSIEGQPGWRYFIPVCLFAVFAAVQFLRGKSPKMLLAALTLGAVLNVVGLIVMPIVYANMETKVMHRVPAPDDPDAVDEVIQPVAERLDTDRITTGILLLVAYALVSVYLISPSASRPSNRR
ncbi:MAG: hypothetical protein P4L84_05645 [Isosphaeraceae bacterium]|nr:hypothetical protein [Isosphaeraceae bacterium]